MRAYHVFVLQINDILCFFQKIPFYEACNATGVVLCHIMKDFNFVEGRLSGFYSEEEVLDGLLDEAFVIVQDIFINSDDG